MVTIADQEFEVVRGSQADQRAYVAELVELAKKVDQPVERFVAKLGNLSPSDRAAAIQGFMQRPDWDAPPQALVWQGSHSRPGVFILARRVLRQDGKELSHAKLGELVTNETYAEVERIISAALDTSDEAILRANASLKEKIRNAQ